MLEAPLDHDLLADVPERVGDRPGRRVAPEDVTHVPPSHSIPRHVRKVPESVLIGKQYNQSAYNSPSLLLMRNTTKRTQNKLKTGNNVSIP